MKPIRNIKNPLVRKPVAVLALLVAFPLALIFVGLASAVQTMREEGKGVGKEFMTAWKGK